LNRERIDCCAVASVELVKEDGRLQPQIDELAAYLGGSFHPKDARVFEIEPVALSNDMCVSDCSNGGDDNIVGFRDTVFLRQFSKVFLGYE
jgi:hypothetical protein